MDMNHLLHKVQAVFFRLAMWFEVVFALVIFAGVVVHLAHIPGIMLNKEKEFIDALRCRNGNLTVIVTSVLRNKDDL